MNDSTSVGKKTQNLSVAPEFDAYSKVIIHAGQITDASGTTTDLDYIAGNDSGRTMEIENPFGTQQMANNILTILQGSHFQYQPMKAESALLDPAAEIGDGVSVSDVFSALYKRDVRYSSLMAADIEAPSDEETEHEYQYIPKEQREYRRTTAWTRSQIKLNENAIALEVANRTAQGSQLSASITVQANRITQEITDRTNSDSNIQSTLRSEISQTASNISATVTQETARATNAENTKLNHTNTAQAFGWSLTSSAFLLKNNNTEVFRFDSGGLKFKSNGTDVFTVSRTGGLYVKGNGEFTGTIRASAGTIGGITISGSALYTNNKTSIDSNVSGIHVSSSGISLGANQNFKVTNAGALTAKSGTIGGISMSSSYGLYTNGKTSSTSTATGFLISNSGAIYAGAYNSSLGACPFQVTSSGAVTASNLTINGGSININNRAFYVSSSGAVTASNMSINGGSIYLKDSNGNSAFRVTADGNVSANNMTLTGTLTIAGQSITADALRRGAQEAYNNYGGWNGTKSTVDSNSSYWSDGASGGKSFTRATNRGSGSYPSYFQASSINASSGLMVGGKGVNPDTIAIPTGCQIWVSELGKYFYGTLTNHVSRKVWAYS